MMISRRQFCKAMGAVSLLVGMPSVALADQLSTRRVKIFGIGGTGYYVVQLLREKLPADSSVTTRTATWSPNSSDKFDLNFPSGSVRELPSPETLGMIASEVSGADLVLLVASFAGWRAANLTYEFARKAKGVGAKVISALVVPYPFIWDKYAVARRTAPVIVQISDRTECIDAQRVGIPFSAEKPIGHAMTQLHAATAGFVMAELLGKDDIASTWKPNLAWTLDRQAQVASHQIESVPAQPVRPRGSGTSGSRENT